MEEHLLLTKDQLVDWLIYHCPLKEGVHDEWPFRVDYTSWEYSRTFFVKHETPWQAYDEVATHIIHNPEVHREITDLYWYWTI